jgi:phosphatidylglycerol lysyltransferase
MMEARSESESSDPQIDPSPGFVSVFRQRLRQVDSRIWVILLVLLGAIFLWRNQSELHRAIVVLRTANIWWIWAVLIGALAMHAVFAISQTAVFKPLGYAIPIPTSLRTYAERQTMTAITPLGAASSLVLTTRQYAQFGVTSNAAMFGYALSSVIGYGTFIFFVLAPVLFWLVLRGAASTLELVAAALLLALVALAMGLMAHLLRGGSFPSVIERRAPKRAIELLDEIRAFGLHPRQLLGPTAWALLGDLLGILCVYGSLRAVGSHASIGVATAGYAVGTLFVLVTPIFQGIGVVELTMTVILQQLGVPPALALGATLIYRLGEVWLPVTLGAALQAGKQKRLRGAPARLPALWTGMVGVLTVLSLIAPLRPRNPEVMRRVEFFRPDHATFWSLTLAAGMLLIYLSYGLMRRQRLAWIATIALSLVILFTHLREPHDRVIAVLALVNLAILLLYRRRFRVRNDPPSLRIGLITMVLSLVFALFYGIAGFWLASPREFGREFDIGQAVNNTLSQYYVVSGDELIPRTRRADWFIDSFSVVGILALSLSIVALARPVIWRKRTSVIEREQATRLIQEHGGSSQDFFKYWPDKLFFFSELRDAVVSYGTSNAVALALGDPVAIDDRAFHAVLLDFIEFCDINGWQCAFHQATPQYLSAYREAGLIAVKIGGEAVVDIDGFSLSGKKMKHLRAVMNRFEREQIQAVLHNPPHDPAVLHQLREVSADWLNLDGRREREFTLGQFTDDYISSTPVLVAVNAGGTIQAFINLIPDGVAGEITFDLMRHRATAPNGAMDFLILSLIALGRTKGFHRLSLGMAPFVDVASEADPLFRDRALALLTSRFDRFFAAKNLYDYKDKFGPVWEPRYLVYSSDAALPRIGLAIARLTEGKSQSTASDVLPLAAPIILREPA